MKSILIKLIVNTLGVFITAWILQEGIQLSGFTTAVFVAIILAILNVTLKPLLIILTLPATILSFGLFLFVINALVIQAASSLIEGFEVRNFWWAVFFSLILSIVNSALYKLGDSNKPETEDY